MTTPIDWTKPLELMDGTSVRVTDCQSSDRFIVERTDGELFGTNIGMAHYEGYRSVAVKLDGSRFYNNTGQIVRNVVPALEACVTRLTEAGYTVTPPAPPAPTTAEIKFVADAARAFGMIYKPKEIEQGQHVDHVRAVLAFLKENPLP